MWHGSESIAKQSFQHRKFVKLETLEFLAKVHVKTSANPELQRPDEKAKFFNIFSRVYSLNSAQVFCKKFQNLFCLLRKPGGWKFWLLFYLINFSLIHSGSVTNATNCFGGICEEEIIICLECHALPAAREQKTNKTFSGNFIVDLIAGLYRRTFQEALKIYFHRLNISTWPCEASAISKNSCSSQQVTAKNFW